MSELEVKYAYTLDEIEVIGNYAEGNEFYLKSEADKALANKDSENHRLKRDLWLMTAEWADAMGLASCHIALKLAFKDSFFYIDKARRRKDVTKYTHRQMVYYKYADYCRAKAEEYK